MIHLLIYFNTSFVICDMMFGFGIVCFQTLFGFDALHSHRIFLLHAYGYSILFFHIYLPRLKPFKTDDIADILTLSFVE